MKHQCPKCQQEIQTFAFYCIRCGELIGKVAQDKDLIATFWIDVGQITGEKQRVKTLKRNSTYENLASLSDSYPRRGIEYITITLANGLPVQQSIADFYREAASDSQEWKLP